ncbi:SDR family oxidoreductase [Halorarius halobius]|uniref:SDR family oxidoreductase n=1 Tax=Halorarius halobius TaxID=2962671 RepID=UPI0020CBA79D|nr:SDR family oxidoreductase [Halorarius halobius]
MLRNKVCLVTGAGRGIGEATALALADAGATVVVNDLGSSVDGRGSTDEPAEDTVRQIREAGGEASVHTGDVASLEYTERLVADTVEQYGRLDGVVNYAGILNDAMSYEMSGDAWDDVIRVHLRGHFALVRHAAAHWRERALASEGGLDGQRSFLSVSSRAALGSPGRMNYAAAKAGILGLTRTAARELHEYDVRVNALLPGAQTRMIEALPDDAQPFEDRDASPGKIAPLVVYLMSDEATDVTGCSLRAVEDTIGIVSDPADESIGMHAGGWTPERIATEFEDSIASGLELTRLHGIGE